MTCRARAATSLNSRPRSPRRLLAAIQDPDSIRKVLGSLGLSADVPVMAAARSPPRQAELPFEG